MVMTRKILTASLLLGMAFIYGCKDVKDPEFRRVDNFGVRNVSLKDATIGFEVTYFNPNNFGVNVKEAEADVYIDSVFIGKFSQERVVDVNKTAEFSIPFAGKIPLTKALDFNFKELSNKDVLLRAEGSAKVGKAGVYITKPIKYQGKHRLDEINLK
jgi:LEA14-like dessication related protein